MLERWRGKKVVVVSTTRCAVYNFNFSTFLQHSALDLSCLSIVCSRSYLLLSHFCFISSRFYFPSAASTCSLKIHKHNRNNMNINSLHRGEKMRIKQLTLYTSINCLTRRIALCFIMLSVDLLWGNTKTLLEQMSLSCALRNFENFFSVPLPLHVTHRRSCFARQQKITLEIVPVSRNAPNRRVIFGKANEKFAVWQQVVREKFK